MKKLHFKYLFMVHKLLQFLSLKDKNNPIIKIWWDKETKDTCLFANTRSGIWIMPVGRSSTDGKVVNSHWVGSLVKTYQYGLDDNKNNKSIYTLCDVLEVVQNNNKAEEGKTGYALTIDQLK